MWLRGRSIGVFGTRPVEGMLDELTFSNGKKGRQREMYPGTERMKGSYTASPLRRKTLAENFVQERVEEELTSPQKVVSKTMLLFMKC